MTGATYGAAYAALHKAKAAHRRLLLDHGAKLKRAAELEATAREAEGAAALAEAEQLALESRTLAAGGELDARKSSDFERVTKATARKARAAWAAAQTVRDEAANMVAGIDDASATVANEALRAMRGSRDRGAGTIKAAAFGANVESFAEVLASDDIRRGLIGDAYVFDVRQHPTETLWSGAAAVRKFLDAMPPQLLPDGFKAKVESTARQIATETLAALNADADHG